jgi:MFS family permease
MEKIEKESSAPAPDRLPGLSVRAHASNGVLAMYVFGYFTLYVALMTPIVSTLAVKVDSIAGEGDRIGALSLVTGLGALLAFLANPIAGALSDRTTSRFGKRRPWLIGGVLAGAVGLVVVAFAGDIWQVALGWMIAQAGFNASQAAFQAILPDQVEDRRRGKVSGWLGVANNVSPLVGIGFATAIATMGAGPAWMVALPAVLAVIGVTLLALVLKDVRLDRADTSPFALGAFVKSFWVSPRRFPDFGWAFLGRFLIMCGFASYTTYQFYFLQDRFGFDVPTALGWQLILMLLQAAALTAAALIGGWLSDRLGRRKIFVIVATILTGVGLAVFAVAPQPEMLYLAAVLFGAGFGAYLAVDLALVTDVLPNRDTEAAKNMGVFNIANALPPSLVPAAAPLVLAIGAGGTANYGALFLIGAVLAVIGAVSTMFIRGAR